MTHRAAALRRLQYITLDVFTTQRYRGNPLALVLIPPGEDVGSEVMQRIAAEFNYSETVFLYELEEDDLDSDAAWRMRIFTVDAELTFAGHPTIGTASYVLSLLMNREPHTIKTQAVRARLQCEAGIIKITHDQEHSSVRAMIPYDFHQHSTAISEQDIVNLQPGLQAAAIKAIDVVSPVKGMTFLVVELADLEALARIAITGKQMDLRLDPGWNEGFVATAYYVQTVDLRTYRTRMIEKTFEDPATGSMSCGLAILLALRQRATSVQYLFVQGVEMGRKSEIGVSVVLKDDLKTVEKLEMQGSAMQVMEGTLII